MTNIKAANEAEAEKYEEQLRNVQKKMQVVIIHISVIVGVIVVVIEIINIVILIVIVMQAMESAFDVCTEDLFNQVCSLLIIILISLLSSTRPGEYVVDIYSVMILILISIYLHPDSEAGGDGEEGR